MSLDTFKSSQIFVSLQSYKCNINKMEDNFVPEKDRSNLDDLAQKISDVDKTGDYRKALPICYSGMIIALKAKDRSGCTVFITSAFDHARLIGTQLIIESIAWTAPIMMCWHEDNELKPKPKGTLSMALGKVTDASKSAVAKKDNDMIQATYLAMNELLIFHAMNQRLEDRQISRTDAIEMADKLEHILKLRGFRDWVERNFH